MKDNLKTEIIEHEQKILKRSIEAEFYDKEIVGMNHKIEQIKKRIIDGNYENSI